MIQALDAQSIPRPRCVGLIEASEESGSPDLPHYVEILASRIGRPSLVVCLDSGCGDYDHLWCTTSLRGVIVGELNVEILREGVHSGDASGLVPSSFRIARMLLSRVEDERTGEIKLPELEAPIPAERLVQADRGRQGVGLLGLEAVPLGRLRPQSGRHPHRPPSGGADDDRSGRRHPEPDWRGALSVTGAEHLPSIANAGNVLRPKTALKLSLRTPPTVDPARAYQDDQDHLGAEPPYRAHVTFEIDHPPAAGTRRALAPWLEASLEKASRQHFGAEPVYMGEGGSIPFMGMLGARFPEAQFVITGVLGPGSNAHGPNEFLDIPTGKKVTACMAEVLADHAAR